MFTKCAFSFTYILFFLHLLHWIHMLGLLSHKLLKVFDVFHVNIRRNSIGCKEYYHIFPPGCGVITETQISVRLLSPSHPPKIEKSTNEKLPRRQSFLRSILQKPCIFAFCYYHLLFCCKIHTILAENVENLISAQPRISAHFQGPKALRVGNRINTALQNVQLVNFHSLR